MQSWFPIVRVSHSLPRPKIYWKLKCERNGKNMLNEHCSYNNKKKRTWQEKDFLIGPGRSITSSSCFHFYLLNQRAYSLHRTIELHVGRIFFSHQILSFCLLSTKTSRKTKESEKKKRKKTVKNSEKEERSNELMVRVAVNGVKKKL